MQTCGRTAMTKAKRDLYIFIMGVILTYRIVFFLAFPEL